MEKVYDNKNLLYLEISRLEKFNLIRTDKKRYTDLPNVYFINIFNEIKEKEKERVKFIKTKKTKKKGRKK